MSEYAKKFIAERIKSLDKEIAQYKELREHHGKQVSYFIEEVGNLQNEQQQLLDVYAKMWPKE